MNVSVGQTVANLATVPVGTAGKVRLANAVGRVSVLAVRPR